MKKRNLVHEKIPLLLDLNARAMNHTAYTHRQLIQLRSILIYIHPLFKDIFETFHSTKIISSHSLT